VLEEEATLLERAKGSKHKEVAAEDKEG